MRSILNVLKILLWALILVAAIYLFMMFRDGGSLIQSMNDPKNLEVVQDLSFDAEVQSIQIDWISGGITVTPSTDGMIHVLEKAEKGLSSSKYASIDASNGKLTIRSKNKNNVWFFFYRTPLTYLELQVPRSDYEEIILNLTSGSHKLSDVNTEDMIIDLTSGELRLSNANISRLNMTMTSGNTRLTDVMGEDLRVEMTSGELRTTGSFSNMIQIDMTSGNLSLDTHLDAPEQLALEMTSGNAELILSQTEGFQFDVDKTSGNFTPSFNYTGDSDDPIYLEGEARYTVDMTSGNVSVKVK